jgi:hypothetical protein
MVLRRGRCFAVEGCFAVEWWCFAPMWCFAVEWWCFAVEGASPLKVVLRADVVLRR